MKSSFNVMILAVSLLSAGVYSCSDSEFSGDSGSNFTKKVGTQKPRPGSGTPLGDGDPSTDKPGLNGDDGGKANICDPNAMIEDANATERFTSRQVIVNVINGVCKSTPLSNNYHGAGAAHNDQKTADAICRFKGYKSGTITTAGRYHSCGDNFIGRWEGPDVSTILDFKEISGSIRAYGACTSNSTIDVLTCKGKLSAACVPKAQDIKCN